MTYIVSSNKEQEEKGTNPQEPAPEEQHHELYIALLVPAM
jgi:hypothetical protein